jgi:hypothetical protein
VAFRRVADLKTGRWRWAEGPKKGHFAPPPRRRLVGDVKDLDTGLPLGGASVELYDPATDTTVVQKTNAAGVYAFAGELPEGALQLAIRYPGYFAKEVRNVHVGDRETRVRSIVLRRRGRDLAGIVLDDATGQPVENAFVWITPKAATPAGPQGPQGPSPAPAAPIGPGAVQTSASGIFELFDVSRQSLELNVAHPQYSRAAVVVGKSDGTTDDLAIEVRLIPVENDQYGMFEAHLAKVGRGATAGQKSLPNMPEEMQSTASNRRTHPARVGPVGPARGVDIAEAVKAASAAARDLGGPVPHKPTPIREKDAATGLLVTVGWYLQVDFPAGEDVVLEEVIDVFAYRFGPLSMDFEPVWRGARASIVNWQEQGGMWDGGRVKIWVVNKDKRVNHRGSVVEKSAPDKPAPAEERAEQLTRRKAVVREQNLKAVEQRVKARMQAKALPSVEAERDAVKAENEALKAKLAAAEALLAATAATAVVVKTKAKAKKTSSAKPKTAKATAAKKGSKK